MNVRISEIAADLGYPNKEIVEKAQQMGLKVKTAANSVSEQDAMDLYTFVKTGELPKKSTKKTKDEPKKAKKEVAEKPKKTKQPKESKPKKDTIKKAEKSPKIKQEIEEKQEIKEEKKEQILDTKEKDIKEEIKIPNQQAEVKVEEIKKEPLKEEEKPKESLVSSLIKRRGLVIVKKKVDETKKVEISKETSEVIDKNITSMFSSGDLATRKKKKEKKPQLATKKDVQQKIELSNDNDMADVVIEDEDVVVLPDFTLKPISQETYTPKKQQNILKQNFNFNEQGISRKSRKKHKKVVKETENLAVTSVNIPKEIRVYEFADKIQRSVSEIISKLFSLGMMTTKNDFLAEDEIEILADEFGVNVNIVDESMEFDYVKAYEDENSAELISRAPVITIMGHVDHGKTSLLDYIRNSRVASGEAGGITQHVGAYMVQKNGRTITFIDTPGHEAFTSMRARGAEVTDIAIIVIAADDGVKPQTKEAINHAKAANVPIIIAMNKMDKEGANPDRLKTQMSELGIMPVDWGGEYEFVPISAKTGDGIDELLEIVLLQADLLDLNADPSRMAKAVIIESSLQKGRGPVATVIMENGTLRIGDTIVAGVAYGKVRDLTDDSGKKLKELKPGECGVILGLSEVPDAGETLIGVKTDKEAREYAQKKYEYLRQKELSKSTKVTIDELSAKFAEGELKFLPIIVKADVQGTLEALKASLEKLRNEEIKVNIIHSGVGGITQNDVALAAASENCVIFGFNIRPTGDVKAAAKEKAVEIKTYNVIYNLIDDVKAILSGMMSPIISEENLGQAEIRQVINVPKIGQIAGCMVTDGNIIRGAKIRVIRDGIVIFEGNVSSLKRFKDDVKEVAKGFECGVGIEGFNDMREGDFIESFVKKEEKATI